MVCMSSRSRLLCALVLVGWLAATAAPAAEASVSATGNISGTIYDDTGQPLEGGCAAVVYPSLQLSPVTGADGKYTITDLAPGTVSVAMADCGAFTFAYESYGDFPGYSLTEPYGDQVRVRSGRTTTGIDAQLERSAVLTGRVVDESGAPVPGVCVTAYLAGNAQVFASSPAFPANDDGWFRVPRVHPGDVKVQISNFPFCRTVPIVAEWYRNQSDFASAMVLTVTGGTATSLGKIRVTVAG